MSMWWCGRWNFPLNSKDTTKTHGEGIHRIEKKKSFKLSLQQTNDWTHALAHAHTQLCICIGAQYSWYLASPMLYIYSDNENNSATYIIGKTFAARLLYICQHTLRTMTVVWIDGIDDWLRRRVVRSKNSTKIHFICEQTDHVTFCCKWLRKYTEIHSTMHSFLMENYYLLPLPPTFRSFCFFSFVRLIHFRL